MERKLGLNVGSGQRRFESTPEVEWINVDAVDWPEYPPDLVCDGAHLPHEHESVDYFVLSQTYEHFGCGEATGLLLEANRVLRKGGSLVISVPNMMALAKKWVAGEIDEFIFMVNTYGAYRGNEESRHKWGSTPQSLQVEIWKHGKWTFVTDCELIVPGMSVARDWWITCLEARK